MKRKIQYLKIKFFLGSISAIVGLVGATIALFRWVEMTETPHLFGEFSRYVLGFSGFAAILFGALLASDAWALRNVLRGAYEVPNSLPMFPSSATYAKEKAPRKIDQASGISMYKTNRTQSMMRTVLKSYNRSHSLRGKLTRFLGKLVGRPPASKSRPRPIRMPTSSVVRRDTVPKPAEGRKIIFEDKATLVIERSGNCTRAKMLCYKCGELLVDGDSEGLIRNVVVRCPRCGSYCETSNPRALAKDARMQN